MYLRNILGFYCNMDTSRIFRVGDTSRIIRVGTCIYVIRIAAVSQEHVPACITRKKHGPKMTWFECWQEIDLVVVWVVELDLISVWGIGIDLILVQRSEFTWFCVGVEKNLV